MYLQAKTLCFFQSYSCAEEVEGLVGLIDTGEVDDTGQEFRVVKVTVVAKHVRALHFLKDVLVARCKGNYT